ncbi:hypothetical protein Hanom_Chr15g01406211 [Helianthus anomalus]
MVAGHFLRPPVLLLRRVALDSSITLDHPHTNPFPLNIHSGGGPRVPVIEPCGDHNRRSTEASYIHDGCGFNADGGSELNHPLQLSPYIDFPIKPFDSRQP